MAAQPDGGGGGGGLFGFRMFGEATETNDDGRF